MKKKSNYLKDSISELKNISWPKRDMLVKSSLIVLAFTLIVSFVFVGLGYLFQEGVGYIRSMAPASAPAAMVETETTPIELPIDAVDVNVEGGTPADITVTPVTE